MSFYEQNSTGIFIQRELESIDAELHAPLMTTSYAEHVPLNPYLTFTDDATSYFLTDFTNSGTTLNSNAPSFVKAGTSEFTSVDVNDVKLTVDTAYWGKEVFWTELEAQISQQVNRPLDVKKFLAVGESYQMDLDRLAYVGSAEYNMTGLLNGEGITTYAESGTVYLDDLTPDEVVARFNRLIHDTWRKSGYAVMPTDILLPTDMFSYLTAVKVSEAGNVSLLSYLLDNNIAMNKQGIKLNISCSKWNNIAGVGGNGRIICYTNAEKYLRFGMLPLNRTAVTPKNNGWVSYLYGKTHPVYFVYPDTVAYYDGLAVKNIDPTISGRSLISGVE